MRGSEALTQMGVDAFAERARREPAETGASDGAPGRIRGAGVVVWGMLRAGRRGVVGSGVTVAW
jgi:hypothetical protein